MRKRKIVFVDQERMYSLLLDSDGQHYLEIVVGSFAMESVYLPLDEKEMEDYRRRGKPALDELANLVALDKRRFSERLISE